MNNNKLNHNSDSPLIPANQIVPEITLRALILGIILTVVLAAANAFLGLKVGQTISASIPAAIISMSLLRFFKNSNVLENTMVQTMASVGEALIAGVTFILPALIILHVWDGFYYWQTVIVSLLGGILGVFFTIPLRRALLVDKTLRYPEGFAITNVLRATSSKEKMDIKSLIAGGIVGSVISLFQTGFQVIAETYQYWVKTGPTIAGFGLGLSPALLAAGYIVGVNVTISLLLGIIIGWLAGVPTLTWFYGLPPLENANEIAIHIWRSYVRYIGVGAMLVGGLWTLFTLLKPIGQGLSTSFASIRETKISGKTATLRTERDIPMNYVFWGALLLLIPIFILISYTIVPNNSGISNSFRHVLSAFCTLYILIGGFVFCSVSAYFAGLVGSTNTPVSGLLVSTLLILCLILLSFFTLNGGINGKETLGVILAIGSGAVMASAISISSDTMQDLKVGQMVGATPWKQQLMLVIGVIVSAFVVPPILDLLYNAYGIGGVFPRPGMNKEHMLAAPQAGMMAAVAQGVYSHNLQWGMITIGAVIAVICIIIDTLLKRHGMRLPVLAVGLGIYLPLDSSVPVIVGGTLSYIVQKRLLALYPRVENEKELAVHRHRGLLLACGIVAGASIMGVVLAIPFAIKQSSDALRIMPEGYNTLSGILGMLVTLGLCLWIYRVVMRKSPKVQ